MLFILSFIYTESIDSKNCFVIPVIQFMHSVKEFQVLLFNTNNSIQHYTFIFTQLNGSKNYNGSLTIQLESHLFIHS